MCSRVSALGNSLSEVVKSVVDWQTPALTRALDRWLEEDLGRGDLSAAALQDRQGQAHWIAKQDGRFCGGPVVKRLFQRLDPEVQVRLLIEDGTAISSGDRLLELCLLYTSPSPRDSV